MPKERDDRDRADTVTYATGLTADEVGEKWHARSLLRELGDTEEPSAMWECCYLCKRREGQDSVTFEVAEGAASLRTAPVTLRQVQVPGMGSHWVYRLCEECMLLLVSLTMEDEDDD